MAPAPALRNLPVPCAKAKVQCKVSAPLASCTALHGKSQGEATVMCSGTAPSSSCWYLACSCAAALRLATCSSKPALWASAWLSACAAAAAACDAASPAAACSAWKLLQSCGHIRPLCTESLQLCVQLSSLHKERVSRQVSADSASPQAEQSGAASLAPVHWPLSVVQ